VFSVVYSIAQKVIGFAGKQEEARVVAGPPGKRMGGGCAMELGFSFAFACVCVG
jgi:hypothetical protein